jgi:hypothetical protein
MIYLFLTGVYPTSVHLIGGCLMGVYLTCVYLLGVYLTGVHLTGVHLTGMCLMGVYLTGMHLMGVYLIALFRGCTPTGDIAGSCLQGCGQSANPSSQRRMLSCSLPYIPDSVYHKQYIELIDCMVN